MGLNQICEEDKEIAIPKTVTVLRSLSISHWFKDLQAIQSFESGSEQTDGMRCYKECNPQLLPNKDPKRILGPTLTTILCPRLAIGKELSQNRKLH